jgi:exodeoxyribonuclease V alpha subunit
MRRAVELRRDPVRALDPGGAVSETLSGTVKRVVFESPDGAFAVVRLAVEGKAEPVTAVGPLAEAGEGEELRLEGTWERHPQHGAQFRVERVVVEVPQTAEGVGRYLEGLPGIGPELARRLVGTFGVAAIEVVENEPWRAAQVKGMGKRRAEAAAAEAANRRQDREAMVFLQGLGISLAFAARIRKTYGDQAIVRVRENPYRLARDVAGIGFATADRIARGMGIAPDSPLRIQAGVVHTLEAFVEEGHVFAPRRALVERVAETLGVDEASADAACAALIIEGAVVVWRMSEVGEPDDDEAIYLPRLYRAEQEAAIRIAQLLHARRRTPPPPVVDARFSDGQRAALAVPSRAAVVVITGGPGTGKTTVVRALVDGWERARRRVLLAAPTGRAARRLTAATGRSAQTVHRLLEWGRGTRGSSGGFGRDAANPIAADLLVVDEASMLDIVLARALLEAVPLGGTVVLVGDVDQLPSVGPGQVLADLIASEVAPVARLTEIFRQAEGSGITENAYRILAGHVPRAEEASPHDGRDFYVVRADEPERARELVVRMCRERIPEAFGFDPRRDVQVLAPMHRGAAGTDGLNAALQAALNPRGEPIAGARGLRLGDKVMQVRNDYERDVFNGDVGVVASSDSVGGVPTVVVDFDGRRVEYDDEALGQLELAYAVSVHKSQGSEYPAVVLLILMQHHLLLRRNLLYTAVTRGKRLVVLVGSPRAIKRAVEQADSERRHTGLRERLRALNKRRPDGVD